MNLELSDDHKSVLKTAREFAEKEVKPHAHHIDETGEFPLATVRKAAELGFTGVYVPEQYGGAGMDHLAYAIVIERSTEIGAFELLVDPVNQSVFPEHGPNMMWNLKYGMMSGYGDNGLMGGMMRGMMGGFRVLEN